MTDEQGKAGSHRDPIAFLAEQLGKAKTKAESTGDDLVTAFVSVERLVEGLEEHGLTVSKVRFPNPVTEAAWQAHLGNPNPLDPPMMPLEDELESLRGVV